MKRIERGSIKHLVLLLVASMLLGIVFYPLFDFLICKFIIKSVFNYSINEHIVQPCVFAVVFSLTYWIIDRKRK